MFPNTAVIRVDGRQHVLHVGNTTPGGVKFISADSNAAVLEVDGKRECFTLGNQISTQFTSSKQSTARIWPDTNGRYLTQGTINGYPVEFVVDTGATWVSMNEPRARQPDINSCYRGTPETMGTANGLVRVSKITLDAVKVGDIAAAVHAGSSPPVTLLDM